VASLRERLANDLDAPGALAAVDRWVADQDGGHPGSARLVRDAVDALLGVAL
jgi:L-cysteine:1D-myo-inositol 2-amino-2-deoxy-alpha-D-glucopyranoside ligase